MRKALDGQIDFNDFWKMYRKTCLITKQEVCNIFYAHDAAVEIGEDCEYGCCYSCKNNRLCGACCNTARYSIYEN